MALRTLGARTFGARTFAAIAGLHATVIPIPPVYPPAIGGGGGGFSATAPSRFPTQNFPVDDDELVLVVVSAAMSFLENQ
jgi:hypothetical protein